MYRSTFNPNYIIPDLFKFECLSCEKEFILSAAYDNSIAVCPYCKSNNIQDIVRATDDMLSELGCMAISVLENK